MHTVLIVEADDHALRARGDELLLDGYEVQVAQSDRAARIKLGDGAVDAVVLGELESALESLTLLRDLRRGEVPGADARLPFVSIGPDAEPHALRHYEAGVDIVLPSRSSPLLIRGALTALATRTEGTRHRTVRIGSITIDCDARIASVDDQPIRLTRIEFELLTALAHKPSAVLTREQLALEIWNSEFVAGRTIDSHANRLRAKLGSAQPLLQTVRGVGYRLGR